MDYSELKALVSDFQRVATIAGIQLCPAGVLAEFLPAPHHRPSKLPAGRTAVYVFLVGDICLKVGKAGPNSHARFTSHHYNPKSSNSNLASSILSGIDKLMAAVPPETHESIHTTDGSSIGKWIERNCSRAHVYLGASLGDSPLCLLEDFVRCRLKPIYEGKA